MTPFQTGFINIRSLCRLIQNLLIEEVSSGIQYKSKSRETSTFVVPPASLIQSATHICSHVSNSQSHSSSHQTISSFNWMATHSVRFSIWLNLAPRKAPPCPSSNSLAFKLSPKTEVHRGAIRHTYPVMGMALRWMGWMGRGKYRAPYGAKKKLCVSHLL